MMEMNKHNDNVILFDFALIIVINEDDDRILSFVSLHIFKQNQISLTLCNNDYNDNDNGLRL